MIFEYAHAVLGWLLAVALGCQPSDQPKWLVSTSMDRRDYYFPVVAVDPDGEPRGLAGTAFCPKPGWLLTCRHVLDQAGKTFAVHDTRTDEFFPLEEAIFDPSDRPLDLALVESPLTRHIPAIPTVTSEVVRPGISVFAYGYFSVSPVKYEIDGALLGGQVTGLHHGIQTAHGGAEVILPFAVVEGLSGAPLHIDGQSSMAITNVTGLTGRMPWKPSAPRSCRASA